MNNTYILIIDPLRWNHTSSRVERASDLKQKTAVEEFLQGVERSAYRMAWFATGNRDDALELVQEAMMKLVERYSTKPTDELKAIFYRILNNLITDGYRRKSVSSRWLSETPSDSVTHTRISEDSRHLQWQPDHQNETNEALQKLMQSLAQLPQRQRQVFLLRAWEGMSVIETAYALSISEGSIKTHYSRAVHRLREQLSKYYEPE